MPFDIKLFAGLLVVCCLYALYLFFKARRINRQDALEEKYVWKAIRWQGGGSVDTPLPMTEAEALIWVSEVLGMVGYVDHDHHFIFYRPSERGF